jgi:hypothetical protein
MKKKKSVTMAVAETLAKVHTRLVQEVEKAGGTFDDIHRLATSESDLAWPEIAKLIISVPTFRIVMDYNRSFSEIISAGNYRWVSEEITRDRYPVTGQGKHELKVKLFHFRCERISNEKVLEEIQSQGFRPAVIEELLALGESQPDFQERFPIVALGSGWTNAKDVRYVPCLDLVGKKRVLRLYVIKETWAECFRFFAIREQSA